MATIRTITSETESYITSLIATSNNADAATMAILSYLRSADAPTPSVPASTLTGASFYEALTVLNRIVLKKSSSSILEHIVLTISDSVLTMRATDSDRFYTVTLPTTSPDIAPTLIHFSDLYKLTRSVKSSNSISITASTHDSITTLTLTADSTPYATLESSFDASDFPAIAEPGSLIHTEQLDPTLLKSILPFTSTDTSHPVLGHIHFSATTTEATDGFYLYKTPTLPHRAEDTNLFLHRDIATHARLSTKDTITATWTSTPSKHITHLTLSLTTKHGVKATLSQLTECNTFPDVNRVIPSKLPNTITLPKTAFLNALKRVAPISKQYLNFVFLDIEPLTLTVNVAHDQSSASVTLPATNPTACSLRCAYNINLLTDCITSLNCDEITLSLASATTPLLITASDKSSGDNATVVLMPMHRP